ncbi:MAG: hypothetical protein ACXVA9_00170 [Bdellovibrionales bacterium]
MRFAVFILLAFSAAAQAQFGIGLSPGSSCPGQFGPAGQAVNGNDERLNLKGQLLARDRRIEQLKDKEDRLSDRIQRAKSDMAQVITAQGFSAIREHRERNNSYGSYRLACGGGGGGKSNPSASAGSQTTDVELFSTGGSGRPVDAGQTQYPPPDAYCVINPATKLRENIWEKFVEDDGTVSDRLCDFRIAGVTKAAGRGQREDCRQGMHDYYELMDEKEQIREEIARLDREARGYERRLERIQDEITEGTYCPWCNAQRRGYANQGAGNSMMQGAGVLAMLGMSLMGNQQQRPPMMPPPMYGRPTPPMYGPPMTPYGYPARPYVAQMPHYPFVYPGPRPGMGNYGGMPGAMGPGAFGCQGGNPMGFGSPFSSPGVQPIYGGQSPFNNPYANPAMAGMFNQGGGPGWGFPQYGNGMPGFQPGGGVDAFGNPYNQNQFGSPFAQQSPFNSYPQNPFGQNPFGGPNPYGPYGANQFGQQNPWGGGYNPYGTPYGPGYGNPMYANGMYPPGGIPNYGHQSPWGAPLGSPVGNYFGEVNQLNARIQWIQNGSYYGGGNYAPPYTSYMGAPQPIYNTPGGWLNPAPRAQPPAVLPYR